MDVSSISFTIIVVQVTLGPMSVGRCMCGGSDQYSWDELPAGLLSWTVVNAEADSGSLGKRWVHILPDNKAVRLLSGSRLKHLWVDIILEHTCLNQCSLSVAIIRHFDLSLLHRPLCWLPLVSILLASSDFLPSSYSGYQSLFILPSFLLCLFLGVLYFSWQSILLLSF